MDKNPVTAPTLDIDRLLALSQSEDVWCFLNENALFHDYLMAVSYSAKREQFEKSNADFEIVGKRLPKSDDDPAVKALYAYEQYWMEQSSDMLAAGFVLGIEIMRNPWVFIKLPKRLSVIEHEDDDE